MRIVALASFIGLVFATSANAQTASQIATTKPAETYSYFKRALQRAGAGLKEANLEKDLDSVTLTSCGDATYYIGDDGNPNSVLIKLANLAFDVLYLQAILPVAGYPKSVWEFELAEYERTNLAQIDRYDTGFSAERNEKGSPAKQRLAKKLNEYRKASNRRYKEIFAGQPGCGGGEVNVQIITTPPARRVEFINLVNYGLCSFYGHDPKGDCDFWRDYTPNYMVSGKYIIRVTWSKEKHPEYRNLDVDGLGLEPGQVYTFSIAPLR
jgi:hypothetical protein